MHKRFSRFFPAFLAVCFFSNLFFFSLAPADAQNRYSPYYRPYNTPYSPYAYTYSQVYYQPPYPANPPAYPGYRAEVPSGNATNNYATGAPAVMKGGVQQNSNISTPAGSRPDEILQNIMAKNNLDPNLVSNIQLVDQNVLNAWTDGRTIFITRMLWDRLVNNHERAFIISHELSHIILHHIQQTQARKLGLSLFDRYVITRYAQPGTLLNLASNIGLRLIDKKYSRTEEYQADDNGIRLMTNANYNPNGALQAFHMLQQAAGSSGLPEFLLDHPLTEDRIQTLVKKYRLTDG